MTEPLPPNSDLARWQPLFDLGRAVAAEEDLPSLFRKALGAAQALVDAEDVLLYLFNVDGVPRTLTLRARLKEGGSWEPAALVVAQAALRPEGKTPDAGHFRAVAIVSREKPLGALVAVRAEAPSFEAPVEPLLRAVADALAAALQAVDLTAHQHRRMRELRLLTDIANESRKGIDDFLPAVTEHVYRAFKLRVSLLVFLDRARNEFVWGYGYQQDGLIVPLVRRFPADMGFAGRAVRVGQAVRGVPADLEDPQLRGLAEAADLRHFGAVPLIVQDRTVGVLIVGRASSPFEDEELRLLMAIGVQIAVAADNTRLLSEARQHAADITLVQTIGAAMAHSLDPAAILKEAVEKLSTAIQCDGVRLYRKGGETFELSTRSGAIPGASTTALSLHEGTDIIRRVFAAGQAIDVLTESLEQPLRGALDLIRVVRTACVPLWITLEDRTESSPMGSFGMLVVVRQSNRPFSPSELGVLNAVGGQLAIAFRNAELYEETRRQAEDLTIVNDAGRALLGGAPLPETLERVAAQIARLARVPRCVFLLVDQERDELVGSTRGPAGELQEVRAGLRSDCLVAQAYQSRQPRPDPRMPAPPPLCVAEGIDAPEWAVALPLESQGKVLAVALLTDGDRSRALSVSEIQRVMAVGNQVAIAIDRASLNAQLQRSLVALEQAQRELVQRERLAALGRLSALVAHEVRNPLGVIMNSLGLLSKLTALSGDALRVYGIMQEEVKRLDDIVGGMLDYTRPMDAKLAPEDLSTLVRAALASAQAAERTRGTPIDTVETEVAIAPDLPAVRVDERLLHQALVNLITNAYHALNGSGALRLEGELDATRQRVRISISDTGPGLSPDLKSQIFEPFFTTKAKGSGLGLAVVKRVVESHHGEIEVDSEVGKGTRFTIHLPVPMETSGAAASEGKGMSR